MLAPANNKSPAQHTPSGAFTRRQRPPAPAPAAPSTAKAPLSIRRTGLSHAHKATAGHSELFSLHTPRPPTAAAPSTAKAPLSTRQAGLLRADSAPLRPRPPAPAPINKQKPRSAHTKRGFRTPTKQRQDTANFSPFTPRDRLCPPPHQQQKPRSAHTKRGFRAPTRQQQGIANFSPFTPRARPRPHPVNSKSPAQHTERGFRTPTRQRQDTANSVPHPLRPRPPPRQQQSSVRRETERGFFLPFCRPQGSCTRGKPASSFKHSSSGSTPSEASLLRSEATAEAVA